MTRSSQPSTEQVLIANRVTELAMEALGTATDSEEGRELIEYIEEIRESNPRWSDTSTQDLIRELSQISRKFVT